ncbi:unnamed protein product, partial [Adineta steineri]
LRDEFRTLKTFISKQQHDKHSDINNLSEMLTQAEHTVKERTDDVLNMLNGNTVATLSFNQVHGAQQKFQNGSMYDQYQHNGGGLAQGRQHNNSAVTAIHQKYNENIPIISIGAQQQRLAFNYL